MTLLTIDQPQMTEPKYHCIQVMNTLKTVQKTHQKLNFLVLKASRIRKYMTEEKKWNSDRIQRKTFIYNISCI